MNKWRCSFPDEYNDFNYEYEGDDMTDFDTVQPTSAIPSSPFAENTLDKLRIAELEAQLRKAQGSNPVLEYANAKWPIEAVLYLYGPRDERRELGERIGLSDKANTLFKKVLNKVEVKVLINEDGSYKVVEHDLK